MPYLAQSHSLLPPSLALTPSPPLLLPTPSLPARALHWPGLDLPGLASSPLPVAMQILLILNSTHKNVGGKEVASPYLNFLRFLSFMTLDAVEVSSG